MLLCPGPLLQSKSTRGAADSRQGLQPEDSPELGQTQLGTPAMPRGWGGHSAGSLRPRPPKKAAASPGHQQLSLTVEKGRIFVSLRKPTKFPRSQKRVARAGLAALREPAGPRLGPAKKPKTHQLFCVKGPVGAPEELWPATAVSKPPAGCGAAAVGTEESRVPARAGADWECTGAQACAGRGHPGPCA